MLKRREMFSWLRAKNLFLSISYKKSIVVKTQLHCGRQNGDTNPFLVAAQVLKQEYPFYLTTLLILKCNVYIRIQMGDSHLSISI